MPRSSRSRKSYKALLKRMGIDNIAPARPLYEFVDAISPFLVMHIMRYMGDEFDGKVLANFLVELHSILESTAEMQNHLALARKVPREFRGSRMLYTRARTHVGHSIASLNKAAQALGAEMNEFRPGALDFHLPRKLMMKLHENLSILEANAAGIIHPDLRTEEEKKLAEKSLFKDKHPRYRATEGSARLQYHATELLETAVLRFAGDKVPSNHIDQFIASCFKESTVIKAITEENIKTIRARIRRERAQPDKFPL